MADEAIERTVQIERINRVGWVVLDRPNQINAINPALRTDVTQALERLDQDPDIRVIALRGSGDRGFCAGADIKFQSDASSLPALRDGMTPGWIEVLDRIRKPVVAAIHGFCLGGGVEIALACDIRIAAPNAVFGLPETGLGLIPGGGGTQRLPRIVGLGRALDLLLTGDRIDATEALRIGLVSRLSASPESLIEEVQAIAERIASKPATASAFVKEAARDGLELDLRAGLKLEKDLFVLLMSTEDRKEAARAFKEKRPPAFTGR
ncbi:enoyl-CoA hydratase/isomerase family protein [Brevundimonas sp. AJA228-03]|uniref:enoyl-CoA hydratase/isomerase family protein n=1 Tax=Brevundimonas sp. AJA228-03 TaxID=2752515 RepID=UPI001ADF41E0|nr:enoyl-CoA hydratase/isomerase family protein [Brevundimonas sp. AJA228-03]QTN18358.1 enoyl-CoA hydratase/isomerase family protein [Brevundimonas sp. AJA228-03]